MISVCIPTYNYDVELLVRQLAEMISKSSVAYEIIVLDDGSTDLEIKKKNRSLNSLKDVLYEELPLNVGRSASRLRLAQKARFPRLLFLDADVILPHDQFLSIYEEWLASGPPVIVGGVTYLQNLRDLQNKKLHYKYGLKREAASKRRGKNKVFLPCNLLIEKTVFLNLSFDTALKGYGHEDTFMYLQLLKSGYPIRFLNNPVIHMQLNSDGDFFVKQQQAIENLVYLKNKYGQDFDFEQVRLTRTFFRLHKLFLGRQFLAVLNKGCGIFRYLSLSFSSLFFLDLWKLGTFYKVQNFYFRQHEKRSWANAE